MPIKMKYGFHSSDNVYSYVSNDLDIQNIANKIAIGEEAIEWSINDEILNDNGKDFFSISYKVADCDWPCEMIIYIDYLIEINSILFALSKWDFNGVAEIIQ